MEKRCVQELNQLLKGTHMGASLFEDLRYKVNDPKLKQLIDDCLKASSQARRIIIKTCSYDG